jgi:hypothetical protein
MQRELNATYTSNSRKENSESIKDGEATKYGCVRTEHINSNNG